MPMTYTVGNWSVASHDVDTITTPKNVAVPDLDYQHDFSVKTEGASQTILLNTSGTSLEPSEQLRYSREKVNDIYRNTDILKANQLPSPVGARVLAESILRWSAANSVSGAELEYPTRIWTVIESTTNNVVTGAALLYHLKRHIAQLLKTGAVDEQMLTALFRGDTNPIA